jgi:hypothetical protein
MNNAQGADLSRWDEAAVDFAKYAAGFAFCVVKASEGLEKDPLFDAQWTAARGHVIRSAYSFWHSYVDQKQSVAKLLNFLGSDAGEMEVSLDLEAADGSSSVMATAKIWVDEYHRLTGKWPIIYSSRSFLHENGADFKTIRGVYKNAWLANCKLWLAEWPYDEIQSMAGYTQVGDALRTVLIGEVIEGARTLTWPKPIAPWDHVEIWQWTSRYPPERVPGYFLGANHQNAVDMNFHIHTRAELQASYPLPNPSPVSDKVETPMPGVKVTYGRRFDSDARVIEIDKTAIKSAVVTPHGTCRRIEDIAGDVVTNGGDFDMTSCRAVGLLVASGAKLSPQADAEPALGFNADGSPEISNTKTSWPNAVGLKRFLVIDGALNPNPSDAWATREPRNIMGVKANGDLLLLSVKGRQAGQLGHDLYQAAKTMLEFGAVVAGDGDGGSSVQSRVAGAIFEGTLDRREVADFVSIFMKSGGVTVAKYKVTVTWKDGASIRPGPSTGNAAVGIYAKGAVFLASELVPDKDDPTNANKSWAVVESDAVNGTKFVGKYVAVKYPASSGSGDRAVEDPVTTSPPTPPPPSSDAPITVHIELNDNGTIYAGDVTLTKK